MVSSINLIKSLNNILEPVSNTANNISTEEIFSEFNILIKELMGQYGENNNEGTLPINEKPLNKMLNTIKESFPNEEVDLMDNIEEVDLKDDIEEKILACIAYMTIGKEIENNNIQLTQETSPEGIIENEVKNFSYTDIIKRTLSQKLANVISDHNIANTKVNEIMESNVSIVEKINKVYEFALENTNTDSLNSVDGVKLLEKFSTQIKQISELLKINSEDIVLVKSNPISDNINKEITTDNTLNLMEEISLSKEIALNFKSQEGTKAKEEIKIPDINPNNLNINSLLVDNTKEVKKEIFITQKNLAGNLAEIVGKMVETDVKEITVKVIPRNLGEITIKASKVDNKLNLEIILSREESLNLVNNNIPQMEKLLEQKHLETNGIMLSLGNDNRNEKNSEDGKRDGKQKTVISKSAGKTSVNSQNIINAVVSSHSVDELA